MYKKIIDVFDTVTLEGNKYTIPLNNFEKALSLIPSNKDSFSVVTDIFSKYQEQTSNTSLIKKYFNELINKLEQNNKSCFCYLVMKNLAYRLIKNELLPDEQIRHIFNVAKNSLNNNEDYFNIYDLLDKGNLLSLFE